MTHKTVIINSRKYNGVIHRSWKANFISREDSLLTFVGEFDEEVRHPKLGVIRRGTISYEYYWLDRWFNVFRFHEPSGELRNYYCNLNMPPVFENGVLDYIDLDIDVLVTDDLRVEILDLDEFAEHSKLYGYPEDLIAKSAEALTDVLDLIEKREFPFAQIATILAEKRE